MSKRSWGIDVRGGTAAAENLFRTMGPPGRLDQPDLPQSLPSEGLFTTDDLQCGAEGAVTGAMAGFYVGIIPAIRRGISAGHAAGLRGALVGAVVVGVPTEGVGAVPGAAAGYLGGFVRASAWTGGLVLAGSTASGMGTGFVGGILGCARQLH